MALRSPPRVLAAEAERRAPGPEASLLAIKGTEIQQARGADDGARPRALRRHGAPAATYLNLRKTSIYGGSNEIQKNIIAQTILGL